MRRSRQAYRICYALVFVLMGCIFAGRAGRAPDILVFYADDCPQCHQMDEVLEQILRQYPHLMVERLESKETGAEALLWKLSNAYGIIPYTYPVLFVGDEAIVGAGRAKELALENAIDHCLRTECSSPVSRVQDRAVFPWMTLLSTALVVLVLSAFLLLL